MHLRSRSAPSFDVQAFTLVELLVVVSVVGILAAVALPRYQRARSVAQAAVQVNTAIAFAMECRTLALAKIGPTPVTTATITVNCTPDGGSVVTTFAEGVNGIRCLLATSTESQLTATVTISSEGSMGCLFS